MEYSHINEMELETTTDDERRIDEDEDNDKPQEVVHKLQRAVQYASRQKLEQGAMSASTHGDLTTCDSPAVIDVREQRSHIAIIQMAPPANPSSSSSSSRENDSSNVCKSKDRDAPTCSAGDEPTPSKGHSGDVGSRVKGPATKQGNTNSKKKRHHCTVHGCTYNTPHTKDLARHMRKHTGEKPYSCDRCNKSFTRFDKLVLHIRTHEGFRPFACQICNHTSTDSSSLKKHLRTHNDERPYKCQLCPYASKDSSQLVVHLRHHTGDSPYTCTFNDCDAAFKTPSDLSRHTRLHTGEKPYKCSYCDYRAAVKCNLNAHMKRHTNPPQKKGKAKIVPQVFIDEKEEDCPMDEDTNSNSSSAVTTLPFHYACKLCDFKADRIDQFSDHMKESHPDSDLLGMYNRNGKKPRKVRPSSSKPDNLSTEKHFQCTNCRAAFVCEESLRCHMRQHSTVPNRPANVAPEYYTPTRLSIVQSNNMNVQNGNYTYDTTGEGEYTIHELQRMPLAHSVITENPAVIGNGYPIAQSHQQRHFEENSTTVQHAHADMYNAHNVSMY